MTIRSTILSLGTLALAATAWAQPAAAPVAYLPLPRAAAPLGEFLNDPTWQRQFIGDWVFRSAVEPRITSEEQTALQAAQVFLQTNNIAGARASIETFLRTKPEADQSAALQSTVGNFYLAEENFAQAKLWYNRALAKFPDFLRVHKNLGFIAIRSGEEALPDAIKHFSKAVQLGDGDGKTFGLLAYAYQSQDLFASAEAAYRRALVDDPMTKDWKLGLAGVLFMQSRYLEAAALYGELMTLDPNNPDYWQAQANCFVALEDYPRAITNFEVARRMGRIRPDALVLLGNLYIQRGLNGLAAARFLEAVRTGADTIQVSNALQAARTLTNFGSYAESLEMATAIRRSYANRLDADAEMDLLTLEASNFTAQGEPERAAGILRQVLERSPLNGAALIQLAMYHESKQERDLARNYLERAVELREDSVRLTALKRLGQLLVRQQKFAEAISYLNQALAIQPDDSLRAFISQVEFASRQFEAASSR